MRNRILAIITVVCMCICTFLSSGIVASASEMIDLSSKGTITVEIKNTDTGIVVKDEALVEIFCVASINEDNTLSLLEDYKGISVDFDKLNAEKEIELANNLMTRITKNNISATDKERNDKGIYRFADLPVGMYLITYTTKNTNITVAPFLVTIPIWNTEKNKYIYDLHVYPKHGVEEGEPPTITTNPPATKPITTKPTDPTLPQTGVLQWPIPVLVVLGLILFSAGWIDWYKKRREHE